MNFDQVKNVLVMVPTLDEEEGIGKILEEMPKNYFVLVVDGGSTDKTVEVAESYQAYVITQKFGRGKGCGVRTGMEYFLASDYDTLCIIDGDASNDPRELSKMMKAIENERVEVVLGSRVRGEKEKGAMDPLTVVSNLTASLLLGLRFLRVFTDVQTGYWAFSRRAVERIYPNLKATGFEIEMEMFIKTLESELRCVEVPVVFRKRFGKTKFKLPLRLRNLGYLLYYFLRSLA